ncbi:hypothetical protein SAMN04488095_1611 [Jannaschia pohangensis]|uniref:Uncharacterized protein n=1 Tax=Jannaschia pohangensis TaxID=390807 RepID=A0A1I3LS20_9RHOB|nr:hypothetical protein SAMN04488095_1611 [Jannaschia pohangensis]
MRNRLARVQRIIWSEPLQNVAKADAVCATNATNHSREMVASRFPANNVATRQGPATKTHH